MNHVTPVLLAAAPASLCAVLPAAADTLLVPSQYRTIQAAVDAARPNDEVVVADGTWRGAGFKRIEFRGKPLTVRSENGPANCILDGDRDGSAFIFRAGDTRAARVQGLTLRRMNGSAIQCIGASPTITGCTIEDSWNGAWGGGILSEQRGHPLVERCTIRLCLAGTGGGVYCRGADATLIDCTISGNRVDLFGGGGAGVDMGGRLTMDRCRIADNTAMGFSGTGGGIIINQAAGTITNCIVDGNSGTFVGGGIAVANNSAAAIVNTTITGNSAVSGGGAVYIAGGPTIAGCILWQNGATEIQVASGTPVVRYCTVTGGFPGPGNDDADPLFADAPRGDYHLLPGSPAIDAADNTAVPRGIALDFDALPRFVDDPATPDRGTGTPPIADRGALEVQAACYPDCDTSTGVNVLDVFDFLCFQNRYDAGTPYACDCDTSTGPGACDVFDFLCFQNAFGAGCP